MVKQSASQLADNLQQLLDNLGKQLKEESGRIPPANQSYRVFGRCPTVSVSTPASFSPILIINQLNSYRRYKWINFIFLQLSSFHQEPSLVVRLTIHPLIKLPNLQPILTLYPFLPFSPKVKHIQTSNRASSRSILLWVDKLLPATRKIMRPYWKTRMIAGQ